MKTWLFASYAHDVAHIAERAEYIAKKLSEIVSESERSELCHSLNLNLKRLRRKTENILISIKAKQAPLKVSTFTDSINSQVTQVAEEFSAVLKAKEIQLELDLEPDLPPVPLDPSLFPSVIDNLLQNAVAHSPQGSSVKIKTERVNQQLFVHIVDKGPGIKPNAREIPAELPDSIHCSGGGSNFGLGLFVTQQILNAHGGKLSLEQANPGNCLITIAISI